MGFDYTSLFRADLPPAAPRWGGFPAYNFIGGHNDAENVPIDDLIGAATSVLGREGRTLATYNLESGPLGYRPLREFVAQTLKRRAEVRCSADEVLITSGSTQSIDLVNDILLAPGDTVIVEQETYGGALTRLRSRGVGYVGVPLDSGGMRMDALAATLEELQAKGVGPKYIYTIPTVQNPTGTVMGAERRLEMLRLARQHQVPIFEDDCYADLLWEGERPPTIQGLDDENHVIYCGSFSKSIAPALRLGYVVAGWEILSRMLPLKTDGGTSALAQMILAEYGPAHFDDHVIDLNQVLRRKRDVMAEALAAEFGTDAEFTSPKGGIFIWIKLPDEVDTSRLAEAAAADGVSLNAGAEWSSDPDYGRSRLRLCFANPSTEAIRDGVAKLAEICHREFGLPSRGANVERSRN